jgi:hypothetical protein
MATDDATIPPKTSTRSRQGRQQPSLKPSPIARVITLFATILAPTAVAWWLTPFLAKHDHGLSYLIIYCFVAATAFVVCDVVVEFVKRRQIAPLSAIWRKPVATVVSAVLLPLALAMLTASPDTALGSAARIIRNWWRGEYVFVRGFDAAVATATSSETKAELARMLGGLQRQEALEELREIAQRQRTELRGPFYHAMVSAFVAYGEQSEPYLLALFVNNERQRTLSAKIESDEVTRDVFGPAFKIFKGRLETVVDTKRRYQALLEVSDVEQKLRELLKASSVQGLETAESNGVIDLVLDSCGQIVTSNYHDELYQIASRVAADRSYSSATRALAMIAMGRRGNRWDLRQLAEFAGDDSDVVKEGAARAIAILDGKLKGEE